MPSQIPGPKGLPILGNILDIDTSDAVACLGRMAETHGPIYKLKVGKEEKLFISSRDLMDELSDEKRFTKLVSGPLFQLRNCVGDSLFTAHHDEHNWEIAHRILMPAMGPMAIRGAFDEMHDLASQMVSKWARYGPKETIDVTSDFTRLTLDTIALCAMGTRLNSFYHDEMHPFVGSMIGLLEEAGNRAPRPPWVNYFFPGAQAQFDADIQTLRQIGTDLLAERRANPTNKKDILNALVKGVDPKTGERMSDKSILDNMLVFLIAGHETTSGLLSFFFYYLLKLPDVFEKAQKEVDDVVGRGPITIEHMSKLPYIEACLRETLRLHPTAPVITLQPRPDLKDEKITLGNGKYDVAPGQAIVALLIQIQRDQSVFGPDANEFRAERMSDENFSKLPKNSWKPFGNGIRGCIGRAFAWQESLLIIAMLLQNFNFRLKDPRYELKIKQTLTIKPGDFFMHATLRNHVDSLHLSKVLHGNTAVPKEQPVQNGDKKNGVPLSSTKDAKPMSILFGSDSGTCETMAQNLAVAAASRGYRASVRQLDDVVGKVPKGEPIVMISPSYNGNPTSNSAQFVAWLEGMKNGDDALKGAKFAVYGCGNRDYGVTFHRIPKLLDSAFEIHGATRLADIGLGDVTAGDIFSDFEQWQDEHLWSALGAGAADDGPGFEIQINQGTRPSELREDSKLAVLLKNDILTATSEPEKRSLVLKMPEGLEYRAGDHIAVLPMNDETLTRRVFQWAKLPSDTVITIPSGANTTLPTGRPISVSELLSGYVELSQPATRKNISRLADLAADEETRSKIAALEQNLESSTTVHKKSVLDIVEDFPSVALSFSEFLSMLPPMRARKYSVSSSPLADASTTSLLLSVVDKELGPGSNKRFLGVASTYLARAQEGDSIHIAVKPALRLFHPPANVEDTPIIMACAGSGLAPFRAFVQERAVHAKAGRKLAPAYLFIGCRDPAKDAVLQAEFQQWQKSGIVQVFHAYSRATKKSKGCKYVQDRLWKERELVETHIIKGNGMLYVCGSAGVGKGVDDAIQRIYAQHVGGAAEKIAEQWVQDLKASRYAREIFT